MDIFFIFTNKSYTLAKIGFNPTSTIRPKKTCIKPIVAFPEEDCFSSFSIFSSNNPSIYINAPIVVVVSHSYHLNLSLITSTYPSVSQEVPLPSLIHHLLHYVPVFPLLSQYPLPSLHQTILYDKFS